MHENTDKKTKDDFGEMFAAAMQKGLGKLKITGFMTAAVKAAMLQYRTLLVKESYKSLEEWEAHGLMNLHQTYPITFNGVACPLAAVEVTVTKTYVGMELAPLLYEDNVPDAVRGPGMRMAYVDVQSGEVSMCNVCKLKVPEDRMADIEHGMRVLNAHSLGIQIKMYSCDDLVISVCMPRGAVDQDNPVNAVSDLYALMISGSAGGSRIIYEQLLGGGDFDKRVKQFADKQTERNTLMLSNARIPVLGMKFIPDSVREALEALPLDMSYEEKQNELIKQALDYSKGVRMYGQPVHFPLDAQKIADIIKTAKTGEDWATKNMPADNPFTKVYSKDAEKMHTLMCLAGH